MAIRITLQALAGLALISAGPAVAAGVTPKPGKVVEGRTNVGAYKFMDSRRGDCSDCRFRDLVLHVDRYGFVFSRGVRDVVIDRVKVDLRFPTTGSNLPAGVVVTDSDNFPDNITIRNSEFSGFRMVPEKDKYMQGDGVDCDNRKTRLFLEGSYAHDNGDGGFDTKCITDMRDLRSERNNYNYRLWGKVTAGTITSRNPKKAHIQTTGGTAAVIDLLIAEGDTGQEVIMVNKASAGGIEIKACRFNFSRPTKVIGGPAKFVEATPIKLGPTCRPGADGFAVNTQ